MSARRVVGRRRLDRHRPPPQSRQQQRGDEERRGVETEGHGGSDDEEIGAERLRGELVAHHESRHEPGVRPFEMLAEHERGKDRLVGRVGERLAGAQQEERRVDQWHRRRVRRHRQASPARTVDRAALTRRQAAAVEPVDVRAADQREQQPRQLLDEGGAGHEARVAGEVATSSGPATMVTPSPMLVTALASQTRPKSAPRDARVRTETPRNAKAEEPRRRTAGAAL